MALGPGKYDALCTFVRERANADGALVIVLNGEHGNGFSCQADLSTTLTLSGLLEDVARQIKASVPTERSRSTADLVKLLRAMATGTVFKEGGHDVILIAAADELERLAG